MALAGSTSLLSFQPFGWWPLQFLALAYFFYQVGMGTSPRRGVWLGWAFGFGWSVAGMHWLYIAVTRFGGLGEQGNIHYGIGWSGNGVGPSRLGGRILASLALGRGWPTVTGWR